MAIEQNIEAIYQNAVSTKEGKAWKAISDIRERMTKEISENTIPLGFNDKVSEQLASVKKENPNLDEKSATQIAIKNAIDDSAHKEFASTLQKKMGDSPVMAGLSSIGEIISKVFTLMDGSWKERFAILKEGFANEANALSSAFKDKKGFLASFGEHARNASVANWLGIANEQEKNQFLATLTAEKPEFSTRVASATPMERMQKAEKAEEMKAAMLAAKNKEKEEAKKTYKQGATVHAPDAPQRDLPQANPPLTAGGRGKH